MSFTNSYTFQVPDFTKVDLSESFKEPYDLNSNVPIPSVLENERVQIVPFIPAVHAEIFHAEFIKHPELGRYLPGEWPTLESFLGFMELLFRQDNASALFVVIDKTKLSDTEDLKIPNGRLAGVIGWIHGSAYNLSIEIGPVIILPEFQRTFVSTNAIGLILKYILDLPSQGGLGYRRVAWCADPQNEASVRAAEKMGFVKEGTFRWTWVLPPGRKGKEVVVEDGKERSRRAGLSGRDSVFFSMCWDDWEGGARDVVLKRMERI